MKTLPLVIAAFAAVLCISAGCETTKGAAEDISNTGSNIQETLNGTRAEANDTMNNTTANTSSEY